MSTPEGRKRFWAFIKKESDLLAEDAIAYLLTEMSDEQIDKVMADYYKDRDEEDE